MDIRFRGIGALVRAVTAVVLALWLHGRSFAPLTEGPADKTSRDAVLVKIADLVETKYVLSEKAKGFADAFRARCTAGAFSSLRDPKEFAARVTEDLMAITHDRHMSLRVLEPSNIGEKPVSPLHHPVRYARLREKENTGVTRLEMVEPGIGVMEVRRFYSFDQAKPMFQAAMTFLRSADAIVVDIRENGGGSGDFLSSCFLPFPTQLSGLYTRADDVLTETWTRRDIGIAPRADVPVFIVTGPRTFSAAECFAYDMQSRKRAVIVGERTKGGAHDVDVFPVGERFELSLSTGRIISPVTGGNWEGTGVVPDVRVAEKEAMDRALGLAREAAKAYAAAKADRTRNTVDAMQKELDRSERAFREGRPDEAEAALAELFRAADSAGLLSEFFVDVLGYSYRLDTDPTMLLAIMKKGAELFPASSDAQATLVSIYEERGMKDLARAAYRKALSLDPDNRTAAQAIERMKKPPR